MLYKSLIRGTIWEYIKSRVKPCGEIIIKLKAVEGGIVMAITEKRFKTEFKKVEE